MKSKSHYGTAEINNESRGAWRNRMKPANLDQLLYIYMTLSCLSFRSTMFLGFNLRELLPSFASTSKLVFEGKLLLHRFAANTTDHEEQQELTAFNLSFDGMK